MTIITSLLMLYVSSTFGVSLTSKTIIYNDIISIPVTNISLPDTYMCLIAPVEKLQGKSIVGYEIDSFKHVAHHISIAVCQDYNSTSEFWDCRSQQGHITSGRSVSLGGRDGVDVEHAEMDFGEGIGLQVGDDTDLNYILIQVHYKDPVKAEDFLVPSVNTTFHTTNEEQPFAIQKIILASSGFIPAHTRFSSEIATKWEGGNVTIVSYTLHTHDYGVLEEGYLIRDGHAILIGRKEITPHKNAVYELETPLEMLKDDIIAARCIYDNFETFHIEFGVTNKDEMCNFGVNFKYQSEDKSYPKATIHIQNAQNSTWCADVVPGTKVLCEKSHIPKYHM